MKTRGQLTQVSSFLSWVDSCISKLGFMPGMVKVGKISCLVPPSLLDHKLLAGLTTLPLLLGMWEIPFEYKDEEI